jgi:hypothetical protein
VQECAKRGLLVMLDMHRLAAAKDIPELWCVLKGARVGQGWPHHLAAAGINQRRTPLCWSLAVCQTVGET